MTICNFCDRNTFLVEELGIKKLCLLCLYDEIYSNFAVFCESCGEFVMLHDHNQSHILCLSILSNLNRLVSKYSILLEHHTLNYLKSLYI